MASGAVAAFSALSVASASAGWLVNGTPLAAGAKQALNTQALVDSFTTLLVPALVLSIQCKGHFLDGADPLLIGTNQGFASSLTFLECQTVTPAKCELERGEGESIKTVAVLALTSKGKDESVNLTFKPETKTTFTNFSFSEKNTCAFSGIEPVTGSFVVGAPTGQLSLLKQSLTGLGSTEGNNSLLIDGSRALLDGGSALLTLANDANWSFD
jgi:hypothetical protein